jgi:hypothetical protein
MPVGDVRFDQGGRGMAYLFKDPGSDQDRLKAGIEATDLSAETPTHFGQPWRKEPAPEIIVRGMPAEMLTAVLCTAATFVILRFGFELNRYVALAFAFGSTIPWRYRNAGKRGGGKIGVTLRMWRDAGHRRREGEP